MRAICWSAAPAPRVPIPRRPRGCMPRWCAGARRRCRARCSASRKRCGARTCMTQRSASPQRPCRTSPRTASGLSPARRSTRTTSRRISPRGTSSACCRVAAPRAVAGTGCLAENDGNNRGNAMNLRRCALSLAALIVSFAIPATVSAQSWPARQVSVIVPLGAGSASDIIARVVMEQVGRQVGQTVVVENRPGAGGTIGANMVAKAAPDGYPVLVYGALASAHALHEKLPYDTLNDLIPVASLGQQILVILSSPGKGYKTLSDLIAAAKAKPGALNYSSAGVGSASHIGAERLRTSVNFEAQHIPFKGAAEAVTDVIADSVHCSVPLPATT